MGALLTVMQLGRSSFEPPPTTGRRSKMAPIAVELVPGIVDGDLNQMIDDLSSNTSALKSVLVCHTVELVVDIMIALR